MNEELKPIMKIVLTNNEILVTLMSAFRDFIEDTIPALPDKTRSSDLLVRLNKIESLAESLKQEQEKLRVTYGI